MTDTFSTSSARVEAGSPCPRCSGTILQNRRCGQCGYDADQNRIGQILSGKYGIEEMIGAGGMGKVYRATHLELSGSVAIKFLLGAHDTSNAMRDRFRREARVLSRLRHPGIVSLLDFGEDDGELYMVMELVQGTPLSDLVGDERPPLALPVVGKIFDDLLAVLEVSHTEGVVHRDLKPENILVHFARDRADHIKVLDFGLAQLQTPNGGPDLQKLTQTGTVQGTPHYMSPEQCRGAETGPPTDIYAAGIMLYETLSGTLPFDASDAAGLMAQQMFLEPAPIETRGRKPVVSKGLRRVIERTLAKRADERPTAAEFRASLAAALAGTDQDALAEQAIGAKLHAAGLPREDRALTGISKPKAGETATGSGERVVLWMEDSPLAKNLRDALAVLGYRPYLHRDAGTPPFTVGGNPVRCFVVASDAAAARIDALRARAVSESVTPPAPGGENASALSGAMTAAVPVVVLSAPGNEAVLALVRAGASDVALASASTEEIAKKVKRVLKRGR